jgi:plasmid stabilization system protein ParE
VSSPLPVRIVSTAARSILDAAEWWVSNRPKAPAAFAEELERALQLIATQPAVGAQALNVKLAGIRRIHLTRVRYHLYYRVAKSPARIEVLALWHTSRGSTPPILNDKVSTSETK